MVLPDNNSEVVRSSVAGGDIAIVGMSCKLPGGIETPGQLWQALIDNKCVIESFPIARRHWPADADKPGIDKGGFINDVGAFDASFFRISPAEARRTDPQQRILLELAWACLEDAGISPAALRGSNTGVFVGASNCDYSRLTQEAGLEVEAHHGIASSLAVLANRLSYFFDLSGPSLLIDTACSSSLVALHLACQALRHGECSMALAGGVTVMATPGMANPVASMTLPMMEARSTWAIAAAAVTNISNRAEKPNLRISNSSLSYRDATEPSSWKAGGKGRVPWNGYRFRAASLMLMPRPGRVGSA